MLSAANAATVISFTKLVPEDGLLGDFFGGEIAVEDDTAVISAPASDDRGDLSGSIYVYQRSGVFWWPTVKIIPTDGERVDVFGSAVAIDGDTLVVGAANKKNDAGLYIGAAYIYQRIGDAWVEQAKLLASDGGDYDSFGESAAIDDDTIVIGAPDHNGADFDSGAAYVFVRSGASWTEQTKLMPPDLSESDAFGHSVAISGVTILVGSRVGESSNGGLSGNNLDGFAHVFVRSNGVWDHQEKLLPSSGTGASRFGAAVSLDGDAAVIGAPLDDTQGEQAGLAYVFVRGVGGWQEQARLMAADGAPGDKFGGSVDIDGDIAVVGASESGPRDFFDRGAGAGYVFVRNSDIWSQRARLVAKDRGAGELFGAAVAVDNQVAMLGSPLDSPRDYHSGSAYVARLGNLDARSVPANITVAKTVDNPQPAVGAPFEFWITATNTGQVLVDGVAVVDELPTEFEIPAGAGAFTSQGSFDPQTGVWTIGDLPAGGDAVLTIPVVVSSAAQSQCAVNFAALDGIADPNPADDNATAAVAIEGGTLAAGPRCYDLRVTVEPQLASFEECASPTFLVTVANTGPISATGVALTAFPAATFGCDLISGSKCVLDMLEQGSVRDIEAVMDVPQADGVVHWRYAIAPDPSEWDIDATNDVVAGDQAVTACSVATLSFDKSSYSVTEGLTAWIAVERTGNISNRVVVDFATVDGTADAGSDYHARSGQLVFNPGSTEQIIQVDSIDDDNGNEHSETVLITLSNPFADSGDVAFASGSSSETAELNIKDGLNLGGLYNPGPLLGGGGGVGGCFIATAAYGSYLDPHVMVLRDFRDRYLLTNAPGRTFVAAYYEYSPPIAEMIAGNEALRLIVRLLLTPLVYAIAFPGEAAAILLIWLLTTMRWRTSGG